MKAVKIYENFHEKIITQRRIIGEKNFTYRLLVEIIKKYLDRRVKKVLDVGCGVGTISFYLASRKLNVTGIDISKNAINNCKQTAVNLRLRSKTKFIHGTLEKLNFKKKFDLVICSEVIEHIPDDKKFLKIIYKLVNKDGILILSTPSINAPLYKIGLAQNFDKQVGHIRRYSKQQISDLVKKSSFTIEEVKLTEGILRNLFFLTKFGWFIKFFRGIISDIVTIIDNLLIRPFGESQIFIVARK